MRQEGEMEVVTLVVMEQKSQWPGHAGDSENVVAVSSDEGGLLERTRHRLDSIRLRGQQVGVAVLACNEVTHDESVAMRSAVAHELLSAVIDAGSGRLVLSASSLASMGQRRELFALAGSLTERLRGKTATLSVRFGEQRSREVGLAG
jgi:hypothetical protein